MGQASLRPPPPSAFAAEEDTGEGVNLDVNDLKVESPTPLVGTAPTLAPDKPPVKNRFHEIFAGAAPRGARAFREAGLVGTEEQQLRLLAWYATLSHDYQHYQRTNCRAEGGEDSRAPSFVLLSGPPGTGKTQHVLGFGRALGLPILHLDAGVLQEPPQKWVAQLREDLRGRDAIVMVDEIDSFTREERFASTLRQFLDGVVHPEDSRGRVIVVGTTNRVDSLPTDLRHRAEDVVFTHPSTEQLSAMWRLRATHLTEQEVEQLCRDSEGLTGRDVKFCAGWAERKTVADYLNQKKYGGGYAHGVALAGCPGPSAMLYKQCMRERTIDASRKAFHIPWRS